MKTKPEIEAKIAKLKNQLRNEFCNVKKCNERSAYYREYNVSDDKYEYTNTHRVCKKHRYHKIQCLGYDLGDK